MYMLDIYIFILFQVYQKLPLLHPLSFNKYISPMFPMNCAWCVFEFSTLWAPKLNLHTQWDSDQKAMALPLNNDHIIYYDMDVQWVNGLHTDLLYSF